LIQQLGIRLGRRAVKDYIAGIVPVIPQDESWDHDVVYCFAGKNVRVQNIKSRWAMGKPAPCAAYDVSALVGDLGVSVSGTLSESSFDLRVSDVRLAVGKDMDELGGWFRAAAESMGVAGFIQQMARMANATRVYTSGEVVKALRDASGHGRTPIRSLLLIGHSSPSGTSIGGAIFTQMFAPQIDARFDLKDLVGGRSSAWEVPSFEDAIQAKLPPGYWFSMDAEVRLLGCYTANMARGFANMFLRKGANAHGTVAMVGWFRQANGEISYGFQKGSQFQRIPVRIPGLRFVPPVEVRYPTKFKPVGPRVKTLESLYEIREAWKDFPGNG